MWGTVVLSKIDPSPLAGRSDPQPQRVADVASAPRASMCCRPACVRIPVARCLKLLPRECKGLCARCADDGELWVLLAETPNKGPSTGANQRRHGAKLECTKGLPPLWGAATADRPSFPSCRRHRRGRCCLLCDELCCCSQDEAAAARSLFSTAGQGRRHQTELAAAGA